MTVLHELEVACHVICYVADRTTCQYILLKHCELLMFLTAHNWQNEKEYSSHAPAMKFIG